MAEFNHICDIACNVMSTMVRVGPEKVEDIQNIYNINVSAFGAEAEALLVETLRREGIQLYPWWRRGTGVSLDIYYLLP